MTSILILGLLFAASQAQATGLDPINNYCSRWYHQSQVKDGVLFIDGGIETFSDRSSNPNVSRLNPNPPSDAYVDGSNMNDAVTNIDLLYNRGLFIENIPDQHVIAVNLSTSWDWKTNITETAITKTVALGTANNVPVVHWGFDTETYGWTQYDVLMNVSNRPSWEAYAEISEHGLAFYLNGAIDSMSSWQDYSGDIAPRTLPGMAKNISTDIFNDGDPILRGGMASIAGFGSMGTLISFGGATGLDQNMRLISMSQVNVFDVESAFNSTSANSNNGWYTQTIVGLAPDPRVDFCVVIISAPDESSFNIHMTESNDK
ncbi:hypothetical protein LA080_006237 [Diaporthe eres]|nr:hypothetical protein LA080_006237 [Diaporthe eres]